MSAGDVVILSGSDVAALLPIDDCIGAVEQSFRDYAEGRVHAGILSMHEPDGAFHVKAASTGRYFAAKTNANFPGNPAKYGLPGIQGVILLFDATNGRVLAILDSIQITILRTGAATAVAAKYLARRGTADVAIIGCGNQGRVQLQALSRVMNIGRVPGTLREWWRCRSRSRRGPRECGHRCRRRYERRGRHRHLYAVKARLPHARACEARRIRGCRRR